MRICVLKLISAYITDTILKGGQSLFQANMIDAILLSDNQAEIMESDSRKEIHLSYSQTEIMVFDSQKEILLSDNQTEILLSDNHQREILQSDNQIETMLSDNLKEIDSTRQRNLSNLPVSLLLLDGILMTRVQNVKTVQQTILQNFLSLFQNLTNFQCQDLKYLVSFFNMYFILKL